VSPRKLRLVPEADIRSLAPRCFRISWPRGQSKGNGSNPVDGAQTTSRKGGAAVPSGALDKCLDQGHDGPWCIFLTEVPGFGKLDDGAIWPDSPEIDDLHVGRDGPVLHADREHGGLRLEILEQGTRQARKRSLRATRRAIPKNLSCSRDGTCVSLASEQLLSDLINPQGWCSSRRW
jgi:hypothetical protein